MMQMQYPTNNTISQKAKNIIQVKFNLLSRLSKTNTNMLHKFCTLLFIAAALLSGCATTDMTTNASISESDRELAVRIAEMGSTTCTTTSTNRNTGEKISGGGKIDVSGISVRRMHRSESGWVKAEVLAKNTWDNLYYRAWPEFIVCGEKQWSEIPFAKTAVFKEIK